MARRRGATADTANTSALREVEIDEDAKLRLQKSWDQESSRSGTKTTRTMPHTQEKRVDCNISNNNDHNYLHKKFKKMASTTTISPSDSCKDNEAPVKEPNIAKSDSNTAISNGSIAASHPEIEKIKQEYQNTVPRDLEKNVQITFNDNNVRLNVNEFEPTTGKTSFSNEFSNKTENLDNDFIKDGLNGAGGRYVCPYCKLSCAKPSVLQKHIRAHTNERPYPCVPCGFAFKTKSNLYKHRRSRTHALRLQGADVSAANEDDLSAGSESDTSQPPTSISDAGSEASVMRLENSRPNEFSSPELASDRGNSPTVYNLSSNDNAKFKTIYKPKFRAALYQEKDEKEKYKKAFSPNADFLNEHISKIISANEAIVDVIETPLQKKYGKIKQIAESKQLHQMNENNEVKFETTPLNLTKSGNESEISFRKRSHSETFSQIDFHKHPLNPEGSIIKDLLLKTKANGLLPATSELLEGLAPQYVCPLCQIPYRSADNLEIHRMYYCKGSQTNIQKDIKSSRPENVFVRSNSINVRLPETQTNCSQKNSTTTKSPPLRNNKPDNIIIVKPEPTFDVIAPLPSPGPLLGNTRLVDTRVPFEYSRKSDHLKSKPVPSPKRTPDNYSPRMSENMSPRSTDTYSYSKIRCVEPNQLSLRSMEDFSQMHNMKQNSTSLQMFGGEVKIVDHSGSTTTLRIEPSKNQLSPILVQQNHSPGKHANDNESSIVVRSGLHSGGTIVHNPPKNVVSTYPQTPRIIISTVAHSLQSTNISNMQEIPHFQFPPLSAITAFNPLTLPPLSPSTPNGAISILHGGKLIPHVPGMPGPNTPSLYIGTSSAQTKSNGHMSPVETPEIKHGNVLSINIPSNKSVHISKYDIVRNSRSPNSRQSQVDGDKYSSNIAHSAERKTLPLIKVKNVDELPSVLTKPVPSKPVLARHEGAVKRSADGHPRISAVKDNVSYPINKLRPSEKSLQSNVTRISEQEIRNFNFETLITKAEIYSNQIPSSSEVQKNTTEPVTSKTSPPERSETLYFQKNTNVKSGSDDRKPKFLRPSTLPLKPGTFTPKRHHGITPNANTMPLVSPETPRPAKAYGQFYANGNAYTYLGLKSSTKVFYCTINRPQPTYVPNQHFLSMYSNWQLLSELTPDPLGLTASSAMSLYDSRHRPQSPTVAKIKQDLILTHSSQWNENSNDSIQSSLEDCNRLKQNVGTLGPKKELTGGFESNEEYTYIRGRGRGRYVCSECGIRCKKPSMLKKHIRTHTNVRPYTCTHCDFSFKTKGNLTKHMKSKAHYKKCCELGINPNEGAEEGGDIAQCSGETDDDSDSDGDEGNEGETESDDTDVGKSRLPEHEAARCLLSLGCSRPATSDTPGLITSARPTTYPYTPTGLEAPTPERDPDTLLLVRSTSVDSRTDSENEPMDLSKSEVKTPTFTEIPTARESSVLASLASNTAKLPQQPSQWSDGEPKLLAYLTERALQDSKIKQSQLTGNLSKLRKVESDKILLEDKNVLSYSNTSTTTMNSAVIMSTSASQVHNDIPKAATVNEILKPISKDVLKPIKIQISEPPPVAPVTSVASETKKLRTEGNAENAKFVVSEYLKLATVNSNNELPQNQPEFSNEGSKCTKTNVETATEDLRTDEESIKMPVLDHDPVARKVVIGAGGVAFKVTKGKEFDNMGSYSPGRLMEDGRRVCDFCNKTFTKPSQLRLHLNIHYMERPYRCSACAVSFRTRGHLQKHERSGSHHNKVSMTSTFGAATSQNPRPFRCSDCNIAFRIHGHLAKHLRSKMHVMRLECLFKLPFGTFTEIERAGVSLTDIDTTDCASSLTSLQMLARKLHEMDPSKLEYREPTAGAPPRASARSSDDDDNTCDSERDVQMRTIENSESHDTESRVIFSATDN